MARPKKQTVDYFPHTCIHGKTLYILEQKYKNDGYAFWFKLLEMLGSTEGHYLDLNDIATFEFLQAKTLTDEGLCVEKLDLLARLDAIDQELWQEKVVWSQNFIDGIMDVYKNRKVETPVRPSFYLQKSHSTGVSTDINPQSKVKETKVNKSKVNKSNNSRFTPPTLLEVKEYCKERNNQVDAEKFIDFYASKGWMVGKNKMKDWKASVRTWEKDSKGETKKNNQDVIKQSEKELDEKLKKEALEKARKYAEQNGVTPISEIMQKMRKAGG